MMTLDEMLEAIDRDKEGADRQQVLTCGATHIAQDANGEVYAYRGAPTNLRHIEEWGSGDNSGERVMRFCGYLPAPEDWSQCVWELP